MNALIGKPLRYLIGADHVIGVPDTITVVPYDKGPVDQGISVGYCNLFDEENTGKYGPYLHDSDTAEKYDEGQIDPRGPGWNRNLNEQFTRRKSQGFEYIELDNPDAYDAPAVMGAIGLAVNEYGFKILAKNPCLTSFSITYTKHPAICGIIVEKDAGTPLTLSRLRVAVNRPELPVWFVSFKQGKAWANSIAERAAHCTNMGVTWSKRGEYTDSIDILKPRSG